MVNDNSYYCLAVTVFVTHHIENVIDSLLPPALLEHTGVISSSCDPGDRLLSCSGEVPTIVNM